MTLCHALILILWLVFALVWIVMAAGAKKSIGPNRWRRLHALSILIIVAALVALRLITLHYAIHGARAWLIVASPITGAIGVLLCACGIGLAIRARVCLGRNWGHPMSRKQNPELVTSGPYAHIRHPIYTGVLLAMLGTAVGVSALCLLPLALFCATFLHSAREEEKLMLEQFPDRYPEYRNRTRMLLPFVL